MEEAKVIEDPLIQRQYDEDIPEEEEEEEEGCLRAQVCDEMKKQIGLAGPLIALGMGSALETLCGQAYGAKQYHMLGIQMQRAMVTLTALSIPLAFVWFYTSTIFIALGQDQEISTTAGTFIRWMIPSLFAYSLLQCLNRFLQAQNIVVPMMIASGVTALFHILLCWLLVFTLGLEINGAALANNISNWMNVVLLGMYVKFSPACTNTWTGFSKEALNDLLSFLKLAVPSAFMICLEYWSFDMVVLLSGLLPSPKLETSVLSISTRVSNELGAARPKGARLAVCVVVVIAILEGIIVGGVTILVRHIWGKLYSNDEEGLWLGIICALSVQVVALVVINLLTNWDDEALKAVNRVQTSIDIE
ncbi:Multi antimicrobial extrusion protein [Cynara cardunculus var. scolymus]|uniref:Multi antimicrobial extrusion protein n=1 Tax=Cynara cardunculus var. scolymus TaxID=59895 RepID=A0A103YA93_CYNCS|nr:Multi antimicrobial extrusion protein [Cynara cardunculus var. scolymus]